MYSEIEFSRVDRIQVGAVGVPGARTFLIQARQADRLLTLVLEKTHVFELAERIYQLMIATGQQDMARELVRSQSEEAEATPPAEFEEDDPAWRVGEMDLMYDTITELVAIECREFDPSVFEEDDESQEESLISEDDLSSARFWVTFAQLGVMWMQAIDSVAQGRPMCPLCGLPMDADHKCFGTNGHKAGIG